MTGFEPATFLRECVHAADMYVFRMLYQLSYIALSRWIYPSANMVLLGVAT